MNIAKSFLVIVLMHICGPANSADIFSYLVGGCASRDCSSRLVGVTIAGPIVEGDADRFKQVVTQALDDGHLISEIRLISRGGSVQAAMQVGARIRALRTTTIAPDRAGSINLCRTFGSVSAMHHNPEVLLVALSSSPVGCL